MSMRSIITPALLWLVVSGCGSDPVEKYTLAADGTVSDNETGLTWQHHADTDLFTQAQAIAHCKALKLANLPWSLPRLDELLTIREAFPEQLNGAELWTSDPPHTGSQGGRPIQLAWAFAPSEDGAGGPDSEEPTQRLRARCVNHIR